MTKTSSQLNAPVLMTESPQVLLGEIQKTRFLAKTTVILLQTLAY